MKKMGRNETDWYEGKAISIKQKILSIFRKFIYLFKVILEPIFIPQ